MNYIADMIDDFEHQLRETITSTMMCCTAEELGLDVRAGYKIYVDEDFIAVQGTSAQRNLDYYGGFEYVDHRAIRQVGNWKIYSADDDRVQECISTVFEAQLP